MFVNFSENVFYRHYTVVIHSCQWKFTLIIIVKIGKVDFIVTYYTGSDKAMCAVQVEFPQIFENDGSKIKLCLV